MNIIYAICLILKLNIHVLRTFSSCRCASTNGRCWRRARRRSATGETLRASYRPSELYPRLCSRPLSPGMDSSRTPLNSHNPSNHRKLSYFPSILLYSLWTWTDFIEFNSPYNGSELLIRTLHLDYSARRMNGRVKKTSKWLPLIPVQRVSYDNQALPSQPQQHFSSIKPSEYWLLAV